MNVISIFYLANQISSLEIGRFLLPGRTYRLNRHAKLHTRRNAHQHSKPQHLKLSSLSPNTLGNVFLLWGGLSGVVHWSQPSVINCHNASKLTNGLCVKEGPLIYWPPLVDPEPIISITAGFHVWASSPANPRFLCLASYRFPGSCRKPLQVIVRFQHVWRRPTPHCSHILIRALCEPTHTVFFWTQRHTQFIYS